MENSIRKHSFKQLIKNYYLSLINSYKGMNIIKTILISTITGIVAYLLATFIFKNENSIIISIIITLIIINVMTIIKNVINIKLKYFIELKNSFIFLIKGYCKKDNSIIERIVLILFSLIGVISGIIFNPLLTLLFGLTIYLSTLKSENSFILSIVYSIINLFNKKFLNHSKVELWSFGFSFFLILSSLIMLVIEVIK